MSASTLALRVFLPFGLGYFLSFLYRTVNTVVGPELTRSLGLDASAVGFLTSAYFVSFAAVQIPLGVLLDRYGPRRVEAVLLMIAATGALVFSVGETTPVLASGRALIGLGVSACLMAAMKANAHWFPPQRLPLANGLILATGGLGAIAATAPAQAALGYTDWRGLFVALATVTAMVALLILVVAPDSPSRGVRESWGGAFRGALAVFRDPIFVRVAPLAAIAHGTFLAYQGLWAAVWLQDVQGYGNQEVGSILALTTSGILLGTFGSGLAADRLARLGVSTLTVATAGTAAFILIQIGLVARLRLPDTLIWGAFTFFGMAATLYFAVLSRAFGPELSGRINTALNLVIFVAAFLLQWLIGLVLSAFSSSASVRPGVHVAILGSLVVLEVAALVWLLVGRGLPSAPARL